MRTTTLNLEVEMLRNLLRRMTVAVLATVSLEDKPNLMALTGEATDMLAPGVMRTVTYTDDRGVDCYLDGTPSGHGAL